MKVYIIKFILINIIIVSYSTFASAKGEPMKLSFDQAWEIAQNNNPRIREALVAVDKANYQIGEAYSSALPVVSVSGYYKRNMIIPEMIVEMPAFEEGGSSVSTKFKFERENFISSQIEVAQPVYAAGRLGKALQIAKMYQRISRERINLTRSEVKLLIIQSYFGAVLAQEWEKVAKETYRQMENHLEKVEEMYKQGAVSEYDLIRGRVQLSNFYPQLINSENARKVVQEALLIVLGLPRGKELELTNHLDDFPVEDSPSGDLLESALLKRSEMRQLDLQKKILGNLLSIEKHGIWWPNIFFVGGYSVSAQEEKFDFFKYYWSKNLYAGLSLSIPLFDGFKAKYRAEQVKADIVLLDIGREQLIKGVNLEIIQARNKLNEARKNVKAQVEGVDMAGKGLNIAQVQYENGLATQLELMDAQLALNQARMNELFARFDVITARAELDKALGKW